MNPVSAGDSDQVILSDFESDSLDGDHGVADGEQHKQGDAGNVPRDASGSDLEGGDTHGAGVDVHSASDVNGEITESEVQADTACIDHVETFEWNDMALAPGISRSGCNIAPKSDAWMVQVWMTQKTLLLKHSSIGAQAVSEQRHIACNGVRNSLLRMYFYVIFLQNNNATSKQGRCRSDVVLPSAVHAEGSCTNHDLAEGTMGAATPLVPAAIPGKSPERQPLPRLYGIKYWSSGTFSGRLYYSGKDLSTPACRTVQEAAFMRNFAASVLFPGNESKLTVVEGGLHFHPEREAEMREIMTRKISQLRRKAKSAKRGVEPEGFDNAMQLDLQELRMIACPPQSSHDIVNCVQFATLTVLFSGAMISMQFTPRCAACNAVLMQQHSDAQADSSDTGDSSAGDDVASEPPAPAAAAAKHTDTASEHQRLASPSTKGPKGTIRTDDNKYISRLWLGNIKRYIRIPKCDTVQEAAFMRNYALAVLCPGDESRQTIIEGGLHFTPEQERKMRETVAKHLRRLGLTVASTPHSTQLATQAHVRDGCLLTPLQEQASESEQDKDGASDNSNAKPRHTSLPAMTEGRRRSAKVHSSATGDARNSKNKTGFYGVQGHNSCFLGAVQLNGTLPRHGLRDRLFTPACKTAAEAAFMRNAAIEVLFPGDKARLTAIPAEIEFSPEQQAAMRKAVIEKVTTELRSSRPKKTSQRMGDRPDSTGDSSSHYESCASAISSDDADQCPPSTSAAASPCAKRQRRTAGRVPRAGAVDDEVTAGQMQSELPPITPTALASWALVAPPSQHATAVEQRPASMPQQAAAKQRTPGVRPQQQLMLQPPQQQHMMQQDKLQMAEGTAITAPRFTEVQRRARQVQARGRNALQLLSAAESMRNAPNDLVTKTIAIAVQQLTPLPQGFQNEPLLAQFVALRQRALEVQIHGESAMQLLTSAERIPQAPAEFVEHIVALAEQELEGL
ncbi:hypothetical protein JKP88DRAFT_308593 [Tribonema minus]|uniref:Uncharacterized protein n=1 Tax=Tribonema minus TaxID=303371 RepID=A0A835Z4X4_9STRA|nr:hypothetical protein JKP88DRAFT_308593 [Tribonema minus]